MTPAQKVMLMIDLPPKRGRRGSESLFTKAAKVQGWNKNDRVLRLRVFSLAVTFAEFSDVQELRLALENYDAIRAHPPANVRFRHLESATELNNGSDVDAVKILLLMLADNVAAADEHGKPERGHGRRWRDVLADHVKCLALFPLEKPMGIGGAQAFVQEIINDKFNRARKFQTMTLEDVDDRPNIVMNDAGKPVEKPSQMEQLLWTVNARLNGKTGYRAKAGYSMHDMYKAAGLPCWCKRCTQAAMLAGMSLEERAQLAETMNIVPPIAAPDAPEQDPELEPAITADPELGSDFGQTPF